MFLTVVITITITTGNDLHLKYTLSLKEALLGFSRYV
jgi:hypothetical protein